MFRYTIPYRSNYKNFQKIWYLPENFGDYWEIIRTTWITGEVEVREMKRHRIKNSQN